MVELETRRSSERVRDGNSPPEIARGTSIPTPDSYVEFLTDPWDPSFMEDGVGADWGLF